MRIKSDLDLIKKAYKNKISLSEVHNYLSAKFKDDISQLEFLKVEIIQFKLKIVKQKIEVLRDTPKFLAKQLNYEVYGKPFPLIRFYREPFDPNLSQEENSKIFQEELNLFIEEFIPTEFIGISRIEVLIKNIESENHNIDTDIKMDTSNPGIVWKGNQVNFYEVFKGLIESDLITIVKNEDVTFDYFKNIFNVPKFNLRGARQSSAKRLADNNIHDHISYKLQKWRDKS